MSDAATTTESRWVLWAAAKILRHVANEDTSRSQNDAAELRNAAAVCEAVSKRV